jgi:FixJ family two-component response regulator
MSQAQPLVFLVDDNPSIRKALQRLFDSTGITCRTFASAQDFLDSPRPAVPACLILDLHIPGLSGLELQRELARQDQSIPIIFLTGHGDVPTAVRAMKEGAVEFLSKPFDDRDLLEAVRRAIQRDRTDLRHRLELAELRARLESLTPREREVLALVVTGRLNKQVAAELDASEKTIKVHRHQVMRKMEAKSLAELVRMADKLGISPLS